MLLSIHLKRVQEVLGGPARQTMPAPKSWNPIETLVTKWVADTR